MYCRIISSLAHHLYILVLHRPQPLPPLTTPSFFGNGGGGGTGGYAPMRAVSGSFLARNNTLAAGSRSIDYGNTLPVGDRKYQSISNMSTQPPKANDALAAARQTLMGRLAAGGIGSSVQPMPMQKTVTGLMPPKYIGKEQFNSSSHHNTYYPSPVSLSSSTSFSSPFTQPTQHPLPTQSFGSKATTTTTTATNANAKDLGATKFTNSSNVININSTPKPFYNASQTPLWKCKFSCR